MQTADTSYKFLDRSPSKEIDYAIAIAGHGTIYTGHEVYTATSSGDLSTTNGFAATTKKYADAPKIDAAKMKGDYPEAGGFSIGSCSVDFIDKHTDAHLTLREWTDLAARVSYTEGNQTGTETTLASTITATGTTVVLTSGTGFVEGDVIFISQEAILLGSKSTNTFTGCTRGYRLTVAVPHLADVTVYAYLPSLYRRHLWIYKGYQGIPLSSWIKAWGGVIDGVNKAPGKVSLHAMGMAWETYGGRARGSRFSFLRSADIPPSRNLVRLGQISDDNNDVNLALDTQSDTLGGDFTFDFLVPLSKPTGLGDDGHFALKSGDHWFGIISPLVSENIAGQGSTVVRCDVVRLRGSEDADTLEGEAIDLGWSNATFSATAAPAGSDLHPVTLFLKFLLSRLGDSVNTAYDVFKRGIGLAIPSALVDVSSFEAIEDQYDVPTDLGVFFLYSKPIPAKPHFDDDLSKPFGWYMATGNDGRIKLVRPKNPLKLYVSKRNNAFRLTTSASVRARIFYLPGGVYTPSGAASALQTGLNQVTDGGFTVSWSSSTKLFTVSKASGTFTFTLNDAWRTIGMASNASAVSSKVGTVQVGVLADTSDDGDYNVIDENDLKDITFSDTLGQRIAEIWYHTNYDWSAEEFTQIHTFTDAPTANLDGEVEPYEIEAKGLLRAFSGSSKTSRANFGFDVLLPPENPASCYGQPAAPSSSYGIDDSDSFASLFCSHMFDRYRGQPIRFKAKLKWKYNRLEVGDNVLVNYAIDGVFADYELGAGTLTNRVFEVISVKPDFANGLIEAEFLGHRAGG